jgi:hypothetical protein
VIDQHAPVRAFGQVTIEATERLVWETMTDIERWPRWNPDVKAVSFWGTIAPGTEFRWKVTGGTITSRFQRVEAPSLLAWSGRLSPLGVEAVHVWRLESVGGGVTRVTTEESWNGLAVRLLRNRATAMLQQSIDRGLRALKAECESRVGGEAAERTPISDD